MDKKFLRFIKDVLLFAVVFGAAVFITDAFSVVYDDNNQFSIPLFILAVALISRFTSGYAFGIIASFAGVVCVNYVFSYPYFEFDFSETGYPLTFSAMFIVSITISTLTTRIKRQEQLKAEAELDRMYANLLRSVSHDIRTPITSIVGSSSVILEQQSMPREEQLELVLSINREAAWLKRVTENILSITKVSSERVKIKKEPEVVEEIIASATVKFRKNNPGIAVSVKKPGEILLVPMDATLIEQVVLNLFENVADHGGSADSISVGVEQDNGRVVISVRDNGKGIEPSALPHLFDGRAPSSGGSSDVRRNMGIGLSVCRSIILAHGGNIEAQNTKDGGAEFVFWLPEE